MKKSNKVAVSILLLLFLFATPTFAASSNLVDMAEETADQLITNTLGAMGSIFDTIYESFRKALDLSVVNLAGNNGFLPVLITALLTLEIMWICIQGILQKTIGVSELLLKLFVTLIIIVVIANFQEIAFLLRSIFTRAGIAAAGRSVNDPMYISTTVDPPQYGFQPSVITNSAKTMFLPLQRLLSSLEYYAKSADLEFSLFSPFKALGSYLTIIIPIYAMRILCEVIELVLLICLAFVSLNVMFWQIEFLFLIVVALICLPWQIFTPTKFVSTGVWQALFGQCIKLFCIMFFISIFPEILDNMVDIYLEPITDIILAARKVDATGKISVSEFPLSMSVIIAPLIATICCTLSYCYFLMKSPAIAMAIISGRPTMETLGSHALSRTGARLIGGTAAVAAHAGNKAVKGSAHLTGEAVKGGAHLTGKAVRGGAHVVSAAGKAIGGFIKSKFNHGKHD